MNMPYDKEQPIPRPQAKKAAAKASNKMTIALDIDETITAHSQFFHTLSHSFHQQGHRIIIVTVRNNYRHTEEFLASLEIAYDKLYCAEATELDLANWKASVIRDEEVDIFFEDNEEIIAALPSSCLVMQPRINAKGEVL